MFAVVRLNIECAYAVRVFIDENDDHIVVSPKVAASATVVAPARREKEEEPASE